MAGQLASLKTKHYSRYRSTAYTMTEASLKTTAMQKAAMNTICHDRGKP
jgi:hypothetical protein